MWSGAFDEAAEEEDNELQEEQEEQEDKEPEEEEEQQKEVGRRFPKSWCRELGWNLLGLSWGCLQSLEGAAGGGSGENLLRK